MVVEVDFGGGEEGKTAGFRDVRVGLVRVGVGEDGGFSVG